MKVIFVRHGETDGNLRKVYQGRSEVSLNETGRKQAEELGSMLKDYNLTKVYSSPQKRCRETLEGILKSGEINPSETVYSDNLREIDFGRWENMTCGEIEKLFPGEWRAFIENFEEFSFPEGEAFREFYFRCTCFLEELKQNSEHERILVVTHGGVIRGLFSSILSLGTKGFYSMNPKHGAYSEINLWGDAFEIEYVNRNK